IGTKLSSQSIGDDPINFGREAYITVVDIDPNEHTKNGSKIDRFILSDAGDFILKLADGDIHSISSEWMDKCLHWKDVFSIKNEQFIKQEEKENKIDLYSFANELSNQLAFDATVITDAGLEELIIPSTVKFREKQRCLFPAAQGAMGYAIPAILGAYYAGRNGIIVVVGDGSIMMNIQELLIISKSHIPVKIFVINNNMYAVIRKRQQDLFRNRTIGNDPSDGVPAPDFKNIAKCFGFDYRKIEEFGELDKGISDTLKVNTSVICEVTTVQEQKYFHMSFAINEKRKLVKRPLEDLSPYLERDVIKSEMIIPMISE
ncbi:MAG: thiamine pyrophosphate-dependent enzyme, partial [Acetivibrio ethanolgignens]